MGSEISSGVAFETGDRIKGYEIVKVFDPGGFAFSCKAKAPNGRTVFLKKYSKPGGKSPWLDGFIAYQNQLKHRVQKSPATRGMCYEFVEFFEMSGSNRFGPLKAFYQVFEWIEGGSDLRKMLDEAKTNPRAYTWEQRVAFARMMLAGINALHVADVVHTDLKPENLYLIPDPSLPAKFKLRVIDMDFSLLADLQAPWHDDGGYVGTPGYLSPEHAQLTVPTKASDVFTCGLMLGELLGGGHPWSEEAGDYEQVVTSGRLCRIDVQKPIDGVADLEFLNTVINGCLRPDHTLRPTAAHVLNALNGRLQEWAGVRPKGQTPTPSPVITEFKPVVTEVKRVVVEPVVVQVKPTERQSAVSQIQLVGPGGNRREVGIESTCGSDSFKLWGGDFEKFMSAEQFRLSKSTSGQWVITHCIGAKNVTNLNGAPVTGPTPLQSGMIITLGKTGKCPITVTLK